VILFFFLAVPSAPSTPRVQDLKGTTALLVWEDKDFESSTSNRLYTLETRRLRTSEWMLVREKISELHCSVDGLHPGECYSFRVYVQVGEDGERSDASAPSAPLSVPLGDLPKTSGMALSQQGSKGRQLPTQVTKMQKIIINQTKHFVEFDIWCLIHNAHLGKIKSFYKILDLKITHLEIF
jgi:hypothetical protein